MTMPQARLVRWRNDHLVDASQLIGTVHGDPANRYRVTGYTNGRGFRYRAWFNHQQLGDYPLRKDARTAAEDHAGRVRRAAIDGVTA